MLANKIIFLTTIILLGFSLSPCNSQAISSAERKLMTIVNSGSYSVPKDLLATKTIVVISINDDENKGRKEWKNLAAEVHFYLRKLSIDAVLYFYVDDLIAGYDVQGAITKQLTTRDVKNVLLLSKDYINGRDQYIGVISPYSKTPTVLSNTQPIWKSQTSDLEILFRNLSRAIDNADLTLENLLIIDTPEFFRGVDIIRGRRSETFNTDLRIDQLAVPLFEERPLPENSNPDLKALIEKRNAASEGKNRQLEQLMSAYPYKFKIIPYAYDEKMLSTEGCQFVLMSIYTSGREVRRLLGYEQNEDLQDLITIRTNEDGTNTQKAIPLDEMVYKYYIKHINSGEIYLGEQWDGDDNWQDAFNNHIRAIIQKLEKK